MAHWTDPTIFGGTADAMYAARAEMRFNASAPRREQGLVFRTCRHSYLCPPMLDLPPSREKRGELTDYHAEVDRIERLWL